MANGQTLSDEEVMKLSQGEWSNPDPTPTAPAPQAPVVDRSSGMGIADLVAGRTGPRQTALDRAKNNYLGAIQTGSTGWIARKINDFANTGKSKLREMHPDWDEDTLEAEHDKIIASAQRGLIEESEAKGREDPAWRPNESFVDNVLSGRWAAATAGALPGSMGPESVIAPGKTLVQRAVSQAAISGVTDLATQAAAASEGVQDEINPTQVLANVALGGLGQAASEGLGKLASKLFGQAEAPAVKIDEEAPAAPDIAPAVRKELSADDQARFAEYLRSQVGNKEFTGAQATEWAAKNLDVPEGATISVNPSNVRGIRRGGKEGVDFSTSVVDETTPAAKAAPAAQEPEVVPAAPIEEEPIVVTGRRAPEEPAQAVPEEIAPQVPEEAVAPEIASSGTAQPTPTQQPHRRLPPASVATPFEAGVVAAPAQLPPRKLPPASVATPYDASKAASTAPVPAAAPVVDQADVVARMTEALKRAGKATPEQQKLYAEARSKQVAELARIRKTMTGEARVRAQKAVLAGEMPKADFERIEKEFSPEEIGSLFDTLAQNPKLGEWEILSADSGLKKLLTGQLPAPRELEHLSKVFPADFIKASLAKRSKLAKGADLTADILNLPKTLMATADLSMPLRQGAPLIHKKEYWDAFGKMFKHAWSPEYYKARMDAIRSDPAFEGAEAAGLALTDMGHTLSKREEDFMSTLAERIPVYGHVVKGSGRAATGFLDELRFSLYKNLSQGMSKAGDPLDPERAKSLANFINTASGRGSLGPLNDAAPLLNAAFFSPRFLTSRFNMLLNPVYYARLDPAVRKEALKSLVAYGGVVAGTASLLGAAGAEVETDPRKSDFLKPKFAKESGVKGALQAIPSVFGVGVQNYGGDVRYDIGAGFLPLITLAARLATNSKVSGSDKETSLGIGGGETKFGADTGLDLAGRFLRNKSSPIASFVLDFLDGQNTIGEKFDLSKDVINRFVPLVVADFVGMIKEDQGSGNSKAGPAPSAPQATQEVPVADDGSLSDEEAQRLMDLDAQPAPAGGGDAAQAAETPPAQESSQPTTFENEFAVQTLEDEFGATITDSGVRSRADQERYYKTTRGVSKPGTSKHEFGRGVDMKVMRGVTPSEIKGRMEDLGYYGVRIITERHGTGPHWHIQWDGIQE